MTDSRNLVKNKVLNPIEMSLNCLLLSLHNHLNLKSGCTCAETIFSVLAALQASCSAGGCWTSTEVLLCKCVSQSKEIYFMFIYFMCNSVLSIWAEGIRDSGKQDLSSVCHGTFILHDFTTMYLKMLMVLHSLHTKMHFAALDDLAYLLSFTEHKGTINYL